MKSSSADVEYEKIGTHQTNQIALKKYHPVGVLWSAGSCSLVALIGTD